MTLERLWYEASPFCYAVIGIATTIHGPSGSLMRACGILLLATAATTVALRWSHRRGPVGRRRHHLDERRYVALITQDLFYDAAPGERRWLPRRTGR